MSEITPQELGEIYDFAVQLGKDVGRLLIDSAKAKWGDRGSGGEQLLLEKNNAVNIVTKVNEDVEAFIKSSIEKKYPSHRFIGEEAYSKDTSREYLIGSEPTWCVDSLDGTEGHIGWNRALEVESFVNMAAEVGGRDGKGGMVHGVRSLGSATLDLAYVAMGTFDIWWEAGCWEWDISAGMAILQEAGGPVTTVNPPNDDHKAEITDVRLESRLYLAIR
ncbi:hypothetical protein F4801DRAFT_605063 [Xylaria longipes]|nr:hypothetical protein F4801DRAFT_605063 [Xylaria longipes]